MVLFGLYGNLKNPGGLPETCPYQLALVTVTLLRWNMDAVNNKLNI